MRLKSKTTLIIECHGYDRFQITLSVVSSWKYPLQVQGTSNVLIKQMTCDGNAVFSPVEVGAMLTAFAKNIGATRIEWTTRRRVER